MSAPESQHLACAPKSLHNSVLSFLGTMLFHRSLLYKLCHATLPLLENLAWHVHQEAILCGKKKSLRALSVKTSKPRRAARTVTLCLRARFWDHVRVIREDGRFRLMRIWAIHKQP